MTDLTSNIVTDAPPDWEARSTELLCPLCKYNLRGLTTPRCPECGFAFSWNELIEAEKNKHQYLFEHAKGLGFKSFWKTYWRTSWPRRFWSDLNPAQPVRLARMLIYWVITTAMIGAFLSTSKIQDMATAFNVSMTARSSLVPVPGVPHRYTYNDPYSGPYPMTQAEVDSQFPLPWQYEFWRRTFRPRWYSSSETTISFDWFLIFSAWPWVTLATLIIFRISMRQANIRRVHLLRTVLYSCDFGLLLGATFGALALMDMHLAEGWIVLCGGLLCAVITTYRLTIAFRQYLRVHLPFATVLASQIIALLIVFLLLVQIADFSRRV